MLVPQGHKHCFPPRASLSPGPDPIPLLTHLGALSFVQTLKAVRTSNTFKCASSRFGGHFRRNRGRAPLAHRSPCRDQPTAGQPASPAAPPPGRPSPPRPPRPSAPSRLPTADGTRPARPGQCNYIIITRLSRGTGHGAERQGAASARTLQNTEDLRVTNLLRPASLPAHARLRAPSPASRPHPVSLTRTSLRLARRFLGKVASEQRSTLADDL